MKGPPQPFPPERPRREVLFALVPVLVALVSFANTLPGDFIFDDAVLIQGDWGIRSFDLERIFRENYWGSSRRSPNYRPLTLLTYALNFKISDRPWAFHLVNVALNGAAVWAFYLVARRLLSSPALASAAAALFAALPIHSEAVANVVGRAELLAAISIFLAWWIALRRQSGGDGPGRAAAVLAVTLLGMLSKENAAVAAAVIPLSAWLLERRIPWWSTGGALAGVLVYLALRAALPTDLPAGPVTMALVDNPLAHAPPVTAAVNAIRLLGLYAIRVVFPVHLSADHSYEQLPVLAFQNPRLWAEAGAVALGLALPVVLWWRRRPVVALSAAFFPVAFASTSNVLFPIGTIFAERLAYVPSAAYPLGLAAALGASRAFRARPRALLGLLAALALVYGARSWDRNRVWADVPTFNLRLAVDSPRSSRAHTKAAEGYVLLSRKAASPAERERLLALAEESIAEALRILPGKASALAFRSQILMEKEEHAEAPQRAQLLVAALEALSKAEEAYARLRMEEDPMIDFARGEVLFRMGRFEEAWKSLDAFMARRGPTPAALNLRAVCRMQLGKAAGAREDLDRAISLDPRTANPWMNRGILLAQMGRPAEARRDFDQAVLLAPDDPQVYTNRGFLLFQEGDIASAVADYRRGIAACLKKGLLAEPRGESVLAFRKRIFDALLKAGDRAGARREVEELKKMPFPREFAEGAASAARELEARLEESRPPPEGGGGTPP